MGASTIVLIAKSIERLKRFKKFWKYRNSPVSQNWWVLESLWPDSKTNGRPTLFNRKSRKISI